jgi:mannosyltransferase OCH1-like enzyme
LQNGIRTLETTLKSLQGSLFFQRSDFADDFPQKFDGIDHWQWLSDRFDRFIAGPARANETIPRIIHQIWIGGRLPAAYRAWSQSWRVLNKDWEYNLWDLRSIIQLGLTNERSFRESPSFGVKSDIARYEILKKFGGVYADTDFECLRPMDEIVERCTFFAGIIFGPAPVINNGLLGALPGHPLLREAIRGLANPIKTRDGMGVLNSSGPGYFSNLIFNNKSLCADSDVVFPSSYFYPLPNFRKEELARGNQAKATIREWSYAIHYWEASWLQAPWWRKSFSHWKRFLLTALGRVRPHAN